MTRAPRESLPELGESGTVQLEVVDDSLERPFDLAVELAGGEGREAFRKIGKERLEAEPLGEGTLGAPALETLHEQDRDEGRLHEDEDTGPDEVPAVAPQVDGSRNRTTLPRGRRYSSICQRRSCRASKTCCDGSPPG